jgi:hypothetical protein
MSGGWLFIIIGVAIFVIAIAAVLIERHIMKEKDGNTNRVNKTKLTLDDRIRLTEQKLNEIHEYALMSGWDILEQTDETDDDVGEITYLSKDCGLLTVVYSRVVGALFIDNGSKFVNIVPLEG